MTGASMVQEVQAQRSDHLDLEPAEPGEGIEEFERYALAHGGAAASREFRLLGYSATRADQGDGRDWLRSARPSALFTWYTPDHGALSAGQCDAIRAVTEQFEPQPLTYQDPALGTIGRAETWDLTRHEARGVVADIDDLIEQVVALGDDANASWWRFDVDAWSASIQRYDETGGGLPAHADGHFGSDKVKVVMSVQLSPPDDYEGGDLMVCLPSHRRTAPRAQGTVIVLPAWMGHQVTPVTAGVRWSLVMRALGPPLR